MAKHGEHPDLPSELEDLLGTDVHTIFLKADCPPRVKQGTIGNLKLVELETEDQEWDNLRLESLQESLQTVVEDNQHRSDCFLEIDRRGCQVLQLGDLRVTCASPPFSDAREITIVRPVAKLSLSDYDLDPKIIERLSDHHRGVFICGRPGSGKTTLAQAIAEYLDDEIGAMVKTMEAPRDLQLADRITQYAPLEGDLEKTAEIIFLVRPDFVIFDEVRRARRTSSKMTKSGRTRNIISAVFSKSPSNGAYCVIRSASCKSRGASIVLTMAPISSSRYSAIACAKVVFPEPGRPQMKTPR